MIKYLFLICVSLLLIACSTQDEQYYRTHPKALQDAIKYCPTKQPSQVSCEQLGAIALSVNELAYRLQVNPQAFGNIILSLQETISRQKANLQANPNQSELKITIKKNEQQLAECLAIVRWLESPES